MLFSANDSQTHIAAFPQHYYTGLISDCIILLKASPPFNIKRKLSRGTVLLFPLSYDNYVFKLCSNAYTNTDRGVQVNIMRACVLNATKMGCYDISKGYVAQASGWGRKDPRTVFCSATLAGFFMTCTVAPWDMLRTKLMNQPTDKKLYDGFADCLVKTVKEGGPLSLWRGFVPIWARFAPTSTIQLLTIETLYTTFGFKPL